jgi:hypothetical protein
MVSIDGIERPSLAGFKQASQNAMDKAKLMVGLQEEEDVESQQSERSFLDEAADLLCPELTFQQVCNLSYSQYVWLERKSPTDFVCDEDFS